MNEGERHDLILQHLPLASAIAWRRKRSLGWVEIDDLRSAAYLGLVDAATRYDASRGEFRRFAARRIWGEIQDYLRKQGFGSRGPACRPFSRLPADCAGGCGGDTRVAFDGLTEGLPRRSGEILWMYYVEGRRMAEIGAALDLSESRVSQLIAGAKRRLALGLHAA